MKKVNLHCEVKFVFVSWVAKLFKSSKDVRSLGI